LIIFLKHQADVEWKFSRSKLYMEYIKDGATLPVPFNIIPTPSKVYIAIKKIFNFILRRNVKRDNDNMIMNDLPSLKVASRINVMERSSIHLKPNGKAVNGNANGQTRRKSSIGGDVLTHKVIIFFFVNFQIDFQKI
jgi:hypothetical protein